MEPCINNNNDKNDVVKTYVSSITNLQEMQITPTSFSSSRFCNLEQEGLCLCTRFLETSISSFEQLVAKSDATRNFSVHLIAFPFGLVALEDMNLYEHVLSSKLMGFSELLTQLESAAGTSCQAKDKPLRHQLHNESSIH